MRTELRKAAESQVGPRTCLCTFAAPRTLAHWQNGRLIACGLPAFLSHLAACLCESCRPGLGPRSRSGEFRQSCYLSVSLNPKKCRRCPYVALGEASQPGSRRHRDLLEGCFSPSGPASLRCIFLRGRSPHTHAPPVAASVRLGSFLQLPDTRRLYYEVIRHNQCLFFTAECAITDEVVLPAEETSLSLRREKKEPNDASETCPYAKLLPPRGGQLHSFPWFFSLRRRRSVHRYPVRSWNHRPEQIGRFRAKRQEPHLSLAH